RRREVLVRLAWGARHLARIEHHEGRWDAARLLFERCVAIGRRLERPRAAAPDAAPDAEALERFWSWGRMVASEAARDLGSVFVSLGDRERAMHWFDEAIALVEGAAQPVARLRLAQALFDRAVNEPADAFT